MLNGLKIIGLCIVNASAERHIEFIKHLNEHLVNNGGQLVIYHTCTDFYNYSTIECGEEYVYKLMDFSVIDALIVFDESYHDKAVPRAAAAEAIKHGTPTIVVGAEYEGCTNFVFDYGKGFENVLRHITEHHGARDVAMIAGVKNEPTSEERIAVFKSVMAEYGRDIDENRLFYGDYWWMPAHNAAEKIIASGNIPEAIVCANDVMAITVCETFRKNGYRIPEDIIITGFDGTREAAYCTPPLTTCKCDMKKTVDEIIAVISSPDKIKENKTHNVPYCVDTDCSCGCCGEKSEENVGDILKHMHDVLLKYQDDQRQLSQLTEDIMICETPQDLVKQLSEYNFYCISIVINNDCFDESINPTAAKRTQPFDDVMQTLYVPFKDISSFPMPLERRNIMPFIEDAFNSKAPIVLNALSSLGQPLGYIGFFLQPETDLYYIIPQYVTALNNIINGFRSARHLKYIAENIKNISKHDYMTGMYNRTGFYEEMPKLVGGYTDDERIMVATIDIDGLKYINDKYGHECGDFAITSVCSAVQKLPFDKKVCGRFGGDELVVCALSSDNSAEDRMKSALAESLAEVNRGSDKPFEVSASIGVAVSEKNGFDFDKLLKSSDEAMYIMKIGRPNRRKS